MDATQELSKLGEAAAEVLARLKANAIQEPLGRLRQTCEQVGRAWSGSNIGYHANVYCAGLQPKPPHVQFSAEWGLEDRWPVHQPDRNWQVMDSEVVIAEIITRAGGHDPKEIDAELVPLRNEFSSIKENMISVLSAVLKKAPDSFLQDKLDEIKQLEADDPLTIARRFIPGGQYWSRDSLAITQGRRVAPHQSMAALPVSAKALETALDQIGKAARLSALHLTRIRGDTGRGATGMTIFVGHGKSPLWRELKDFLADRLHLHVDEFNRVSTAGVPTATRLSEMLGSGLIDQSQKMTVAAMQMADMKVWAHLS